MTKSRHLYTWKELILFETLFCQPNKNMAPDMDINPDVNTGVFLLDGAGLFVCPEVQK